MAPSACAWFCCPGSFGCNGALTAHGVMIGFTLEKTGKTCSLLKKQPHCKEWFFLCAESMFLWLEKVNLSTVVQCDQGSTQPLSF